MSREVYYTTELLKSHKAEFNLEFDETTTTIKFIM